MPPSPDSKTDDLGASFEPFLAWISEADVPFWRIDVEGRILFLNQAWSQGWVTNPQGALGKPFISLFMEADRTALETQLRECMQSRLSGSITARVLSPSQKIFHLQLSGKAWVDATGTLLGLQGMVQDVTATQTTEAQLAVNQARLNEARSNETHFRSFISNAPTAIAMFDLNLHYIAYSQRWCDDYGLKDQNLIGKHHYDVFPSIRENEYWKDVHLKCLAGESRHSDHDTFIGADGNREWLRWDVRPWFLQSGKVGGILMLTESISSRVRAENDLRASEERYRQLADSAFEAIIIHHNGVIVDINASFLELFQFDSVNEVIGKNGLEIVIAPESRNLIRERIQKGINTPTEVMCRKKDGSTFYAMTQTREIEYQGKPMRLVTMRDITDRKMYVDALSAEKERLLVTLRSIGDGVIATDTQGRVVIMNAVAESLTGWTQQEAELKPLTDIFAIVHEYTREVCENPVEKVLATGETIELANHTVLISRDGQERVITDSGAPIRDSQNQIIGVVLVFRDTTDKQRLFESAQRAQKLESLGILAGGIAHDFNNLLGGIFGFIDIAHAKTKEEKIAEYLTKAMATIDRAKGLTQQLLTFAKGGLPIRKVGSLFPFVRETVQFVMSGTAVTSHFKVAPDLFSSNFDRNQIGQVIDNLAINAQQAMPLGGTFHITAENVHIVSRQIEGLHSGPYIRIAFQDSGSGISPEILSRIFDPFFTTKKQGSGLGLATCYSILQQHDGVIEVQSELGKGATFILYLPASLEIPESHPSTPIESPMGRGLFVIMDDEEVIRETLSEMLSIQGYQVKAFSDGRDVLEFLQTTPNPLTITGIILDLTVPGGMGGREAAIAIRNWSSTVPIFISSGYAEDPIMSDPHRFGVTGSLSKPFRRTELFAILNQYLL